MKLSIHAKERLKSRFGLNSKDIQIIGGYLNNTGQYKIIKIENNFKEIREICYLKKEEKKIKKYEIQFIIINCIVVTAIPSIHAQDDNLKSIDYIDLVSMELEKLKKTTRSFLSLPLWKAFFYLLKIRKNMN
jgi:hypothetical protein